MRKAEKIILSLFTLIAAWAFCAPAHSADPKAQDADLQRGHYLVDLLQCSSCHTPGALMGRPDMSLYLAGSNIGYEIPKLGVFYGPNLTMDTETGLGKWSKMEIITAIRAGVRPDGRILVPSMPSRAFSHLTDEDASAIVVYLTSLQPISHRAAGPFGPDEPATAYVVRIIPPPMK